MSHHPGTHAAGGGGGKISGGKTMPRGARPSAAAIKKDIAKLHRQVLAEAMRSPTKKKVETLAAFHRVAKKL